jgi:hypothetical protein
VCYINECSLLCLSVLGAKQVVLYKFLTMFIFLQLPNLKDEQRLICKFLFHILRCLEQNITTERVAELKSMIKVLNSKLAQMYGDSSLSYNTHMLFHMPEHVHRFGPAMSFSCYSFESANHVISTYIRGYNYGLKEVSKR